MTSETNQDTPLMLDRTSPPIACSLTERALRSRSLRLRQALEGGDLERTERGLLTRLRLEDGALKDLAELVDLERQCCSFFDFALRIPSPGEHVIIEVSGPPEAQGLIEEFFASSRAGDPSTSGRPDQRLFEGRSKGLASKLVGGGASLALAALGLLACCGLPAAGLLSAAGLSAIFARTEGLLLLSGLAATMGGAGLWLWQRKRCAC